MKAITYFVLLQKVNGINSGWLSGFWIASGLGPVYGLMGGASLMWRAGADHMSCTSNLIEVIGLLKYVARPRIGLGFESGDVFRRALEVVHLIKLSCTCQKWNLDWPSSGFITLWEIWENELWKL